MAEIQFLTKDGPWTLPADLLEALRETYPRVDVDGELKKARLWCQVHAEKRKTAKGMPRFLATWMNTASKERLGRADIPREPSIWERAEAYARRRASR